ncbi:hypothetical protein CONLIGDRAFT_437446 [Coniochaeta ligniaria NRRL 30616]|uniref:Uncharacterized protein n=1 Tax=Coniochaeta ligniaria NRRL 30616 TaxID=1408157 RepID=A0A1J7J2K4_9PEZI|nr:hypothetical protein CONLIGDRAFT_437446 [Coniochaeta ligniaria NRRL 30616]
MASMQNCKSRNAELQQKFLEPQHAGTFCDSTRFPHRLRGEWGPARPFQRPETRRTSPLSTDFLRKRILRFSTKGADDLHGNHDASTCTMLRWLLRCPMPPLPALTASRGKVSGLSVLESSCIDHQSCMLRSLASCSYQAHWQSLELLVVVSLGTAVPPARGSIHTVDLHTTPQISTERMSYPTQKWIYHGASKCAIACIACRRQSIGSVAMSSDRSSITTQLPEARDHRPRRFAR